MRIYLHDILGVISRMSMYLLPGVVLGGLTLGLSANWIAATAVTLLAASYSWLTVLQPYRSGQQVQCWRELMRLTRKCADGETLVATVDREIVVFVCQRKKNRELLRTFKSNMQLPQIDAERGIIHYDKFILTSMWSVVRVSDGWPIELDDEGYPTYSEDESSKRTLTAAQRRAAADAYIESGYYRPSDEELRELVAQLRAAQHVP